jgi:hypothetical protein
MHNRPDSKEKRARAIRYNCIACTVRNSLAKRKSTERAREIFDTPPYYLTIKHKQEKEKKKENEHNN